MIAAKQTAYLMTRALPSCLLLIVLNVVLIFTLPVSKAAMAASHLPGFEYRIINFATSLPSFLVWAAAFVGYAKLLEYAHSIRHTPEGSHFYKLVRGSAWLAWSLPVTKIISIILVSFSNIWPGFYDTAIVLSNYLGLILPLIAFTFIGSSVRGLANDAKLRLSPASTNAIMLLFALAGVSYCYFVFRNFDMSSLTSSHNPYFLPMWLMVVSIIIPYLYIWFVGLLAAFDLALYSNKIRGNLYKHALAFLAVGLVVVIVGSIALQYINTVQPRTGFLVLDWHLALILSFRVVQGIGFILIALGASKLKRIEEV